MQRFFENSSNMSSVLHEFSVENFRSIDQLQRVSLDANGGINDMIEGGEGAGYFELPNRARLLTVKTFYGYNSSGKSNLLLSLHRMKGIVRHAVRLNENESLPYEPFLLKDGAGMKPTRFEVVFTKERDTYRYGFSYNQTAIEEEWLYVKMPGKSVKEVFSRKENTWNKTNPNFVECNVNVTINKNRLLLSLLGQLGGATSNTVLEWFANDLVIVSGAEDNGYSEVSRNMLLGDEDAKASVIELMTRLNLGFGKMQARQVSMDEMGLPDGLPSSFINQLRAHPPIEVKTEHNIYDDDGCIVGTRYMLLDRTESEGTKKLFGLAGLIIQAIQNGTTLVVDEFDSKIHPNLCRKLVTMFNSRQHNPKGAQLIFSTHDTNLLDNTLLRRDQICFVKKTSRESSKVYELMDVVLENGHKPRNDSNYEKNYLAGNYDNIAE